MRATINPYIAGAPVTEARMFFGRSDVFEWIEHNLSGRYADHILVIHGQRRVGKTSVLKQLHKQLPKRYIPFFFDLQGRTQTSLGRFLWWLAREIARALKQERGLDIVVPERDVFESDAEFFETHFLPDIISRLGKSRLLLTFDEFDNLEVLDARDGLARPLIETLQRLMQVKGINFIFSIGSSGRKLENMQAAYTEFFKSALYKKISFLSVDECRALITEPVQGTLDFDPAAVEHIHAITSGHPYFTQLLCHELFSIFQKTGKARIRKKDVDAILDDTVERGTVNLKFVWDEASDLEKWSLAALAVMEGDVDENDLSDFLQRQKVRFTNADLSSALVHLREKDVLTAGNRFIIYLQKIWIRRNRTLDQVREELVEINPIANRYIEIGQEYRNSGDPGKALDSFREALKVTPGNMQAHVCMAGVFFDQAQYEQAAREYQDALAIDEEDVSARTGMCATDLALGDRALSEGKPDTALEAYQRVLAINAEHTEARQRIADIHASSAQDAYLAGDKEAALRELEHAAGFVPEDARLGAKLDELRAEIFSGQKAALLVAAVQARKQKDWTGALHSLEQAGSLDPQDADIPALAAAVRHERRQDQLAGLLTSAGRLLPSPENAWKRLAASRQADKTGQLAYRKHQAGQAFLDLDLVEQAVKEFSESHRLEPDLSRNRYAFALLRLGSGYEKGGDTGKALELYRAAGDLLPEGGVRDALEAVIDSIGEAGPVGRSFSEIERNLLFPRLDGQVHAGEKARRRGFPAWAAPYGRWVLFSFAGALLALAGWIGLWILLRPDLRGNNPIAYLWTFLMALPAGAVLGLSTWLRLRKKVKRFYWWILISAGAWALGMTAFVFLRPRGLWSWDFLVAPGETPFAYRFFIPGLLAFFTGLPVGLGQYLFLRGKKLLVPLLWIPLTLVVHLFSLVAGFLVGGIPGMLIGVVVYSLATGALFTSIEYWQDVPETLQPAWHTDMGGENGFLLQRILGGIAIALLLLETISGGAVWSLEPGAERYPIIQLMVEPIPVERLISLHPYAVLGADDASLVVPAPDGTFIAVVDEVGVFFYDAETLAQTRGILLSESKVTSLVFSPDGSMMVTGSEDDIIRLWEVSGWMPQGTLEGHTGTIYSLAFSPDGHLLASGSHDQTVRLWNVTDRALLRTLDGHTSSVKSVAFSPDGKILASASSDETIRLWNIPAGSSKQVLSPQGGTLYSIAFSPDGTLLASAANDGKVSLWNPADGSRVDDLVYDPTPTGNNADRVESVSFSPDGETLLAGYWMKGAVLWHVASGEIYLEDVGNSWNTAFSPDGRYLISTDDRLSLWDNADGSLVRSLTRLPYPIEASAFSPDGSLYAAGMRSYLNDHAGEEEYWKIYIWNTSDGTLLRTLTGHTDDITSLAFSPDGESIASGSNDATLRLWRVSDGTQLQVIEGIEGNVLVTFSPDGSMLATKGDHQPVALRKSSDGSVVRSFEGGRRYGTRDLAFSPDGLTIGAVQGDGNVGFWNTADGRLVRRLFLEGTFMIAFSPDGQFFTTYAYNRLRVWRYSDGACIQVIQVGSNPVFSPDGKTLTVSHGDRVEFLQYRDGRFVSTGTYQVRGGGGITSYVFSPDGKYFAIAQEPEDYDTNILLYQLTP